ncbi:MAG TPA: hypothetical protein VE546_22550 [Streptomyces sp.]|nr:hypothetical protein [Streptomyces sp.]
MPQSLEPAEETGGESVPSPATAGLLVDDGGARVLTKHPLDARAARRLMRRAADHRFDPRGDRMNYFLSPRRIRRTSRLKAR